MSEQKPIRNKTDTLFNISLDYTVSQYWAVFTVTKDTATVDHFMVRTDGGQVRACRLNKDLRKYKIVCHDNEVTLTFPGHDAEVAVKSTPEFTEVKF